MITVPLLNNIHLKPLAKRMALTATPEIVPVQPDKNAVPNECFNNVLAKVESDGGQRIIGWQIWQQPYMLEAELHAA